MRSSLITTLFTAPAPSRRGPSTILVSILLHSAGLLLYGLPHTPRMEGVSVPQRYPVRLLSLLSLPRSELVAAQLGDAGVAYHGPRSLVPRAASLRHASAYDPSLHPTPQTLVQPDAPADRLPQQVPPIPEVVMWSADHTPNTIVSATPHPADAGDLRPSLAMPNHASNLAELAIAPTLSVAQTQIAASTTAPLPLHGPEPAQQIPETASQPLEHSSPARIVSLSAQQVRGPILIPFANAAPASATSEPRMPGPPEQTATREGEGSGNDADGSRTGPASGRQHESDTGQGAASRASSDAGGEPSVTRIKMPKDGQFGVVVVGSSLADEYPETVAIWSGRLVYTVYLHVGLGKSWILQYALPIVEEASSVTRPEAPWPYEIVRPEQVDFTSGAVMVHGFIDVTGHFERLAVVSPVGFPQRPALLDALRQWQFRAARQNGQLAEVEVLLVIPEENE